ncbi:hypothetical protein VE03_00056 [Pseudogymnoascus sp. 23342-1-I1]|nr:hypothetical protein VE03_00056 [Pseudogymnoascus sp. 23342-1-I1]
MASPRIISMDFSTNGRDDCYFRILSGTNVKYIIIQAGALNEDSLMDMPLNFQNIIPSVPYDKDDWNSAYISRNTASNDMLAEECVWKQGTAGDEIRDQQTMIANMARFSWEIHPSGVNAAFVALTSLDLHLPTPTAPTDHTNIEGRPANLGNLEICKATLQRLHDKRILHGDCNRYNFIVGADDKVTLIDFDNAKVDADTEMMEREMASLEEQLREETGRGGGFIEVESD